MKFWLSLALLGLSLPVAHFSSASDDDEVRIAAEEVVNAPAKWPELRRSRDAWMQHALRARIDDLGLSRAADNGQLAVALVDITDASHPRMAGVNSDQAMYAASLPKIAILLGAFHKANAGMLDLNVDVTTKLTSMIRSSSNSAATLMLEQVGYDYLADVLQSDTYKLYDPERNGGLWVGKAYARKGAWKRDPLNNLSHSATPFEVARFYYLLETGRLVSADDSEDMKEILSEPAIRHKFVRGLEEHRPGSRIFRKSGTWGSFHSDSAVVERDGRRYIAVALANSASGGEWLANLIVCMDDVIHHPENVARDGRRLSAIGPGLDAPVFFGLARLGPIASTR